MEEIAQAIFEIFFQFVFEVVVDAVWRRLPESARTTIKTIACPVFGALLGFLSTFAVPEAFIRSEVQRIVYLVLGPVVIGGIMSQLGTYHTGHGRRRSSLEKFGYAWLFAFAFALSRYLLTK